ncbi:MAG: HAMP domain-containing protein [Treponema sp.]|jgi:signal transduction histidine kinase|nr:HAMP domain-containing protein [Treponema sp.]
MTIKRRLFFSNIRIVFISFFAFGIAGFIVRALMFGPRPRDANAMERLSDSIGHDLQRTIWFLTFALFIVLISVINNVLTYRMTKRIVQPLEPLNEGVRQIHDNNFAFRIAYNGNDEFTPVCEAFNEMAAQLEISTSQQKKDEANRRELIAGISHDLRTPLTSIKGYIEGLETGVASTAEMQKKYLAIIKNKTADMEHIIEQLFLFSKLDMDEYPLPLRPVDISLAVSDMIEDSLSEYAARGLAIQFAGMPENAIVSADVLMLRNVIINILENSVRYKAQEHGQMEISAAVVQDSVFLRLADNGPGVPADMLPNLFDVFYRTDPSRSTLGSGLGLAICAKIIERMGGSIHAEASASGGLAIVMQMPVLKGEAP